MGNCIKHDLIMDYFIQLQEWLVLSSDYEILVTSVVDHVSTLMDDCLVLS